MSRISWSNAQYLGHKNLERALNQLKQSLENVVLMPPAVAGVSGADYRGEGTYGAAGIIQAATTFAYRIGATVYQKGASLIPGLIDADNTIAHGYKAGVVLIDSDGTYSFIVGEESTAGGKAAALGYLLDAISNTDLDSKAVVAVFVAGSGNGAFLSTTSLTVGTNLDVYSCGGMALSSGLSTDGFQLLGLL